ncbi:peptidylprolyl isomerase [Novacetimonas cocois]|uniref:Parvulin-like PPIase n=1 Tax=Novacetimonas cocois TaxID=1747507 RepID=A0A365YS60_9PROT|nr:peptidylprolyl isomerase [Novacetimonas cocois]RBM05439.1 peptidylprolyl isomerase [Novacetimonas cocois]
MLSFLCRIFVDSWVGRIVVGLFFLTFVGWGVGDVLMNIGTERADVVARVGPDPILVPAYEQALRTEMPQIAQQMHLQDPSQIPATTREQIAQQVLQRLVLQAEVALAARNHGLLVPDSAVRAEIFAIPAFQDKNGKFDRDLFNNRLRNSGMTEGRLIELVRAEQASKALMEPIRSGATAPDILTRRIFDLEAQTRRVDIVRVPFASQTPAAPTDAQMHRFYANHPWLFQAPEYRHARIVVLSPETMARSITIPDADLRHMYEQQSQRFNTPETRSVQVITAPTEARARELLNTWQQGANWDAMQKDAGRDSASVEMNDIRIASVPSQDLGRKIFAAPADAIQPPVHTDGGWAIFRVTHVTPAHVSDFESARPALQSQAVAEQVQAQMGDRVQKLQDAIAGGGLDSIPTDIGAAAMSGNIDAHGMTQEGTPAPIPGSDAVRQAITGRIFTQPKGGSPELIQGPEGTWYAVMVDGITPAQPQSYEASAGKVRDAWMADAQRHAADQSATDLYNRAQDGGGLAHLQPAIADLVHSAEFSRTHDTPDVPHEVAEIAFRLDHPGQSLMIEADGAFYVATLTDISRPDPSTQRMLFDRIRASLTQAVADDVEMSYAMALQATVKPKPNPSAINAVMSAVSGKGNPEAGQ